VIAGHAVRQPRHAEGRAGGAGGARAEEAPPAQPGAGLRGEFLVTRLAAAALVALLLSGCSGLQLAYDNADTYLRWRITGELDLHGDAVDELDDRIREFIAWHRREALPQYARIADDAEQRLARGLSRADLVWGYDGLTHQGTELAVAAAQRIAPLL